tara:strand:+ start:33 stop:341 length:309 start_codon:yes stop_codon:yes gene_type:complete
MGNLCCIISDEDNYEQNTYKYINQKYIKEHNDDKRYILINTYIDTKMWVSVSLLDYEKYKNNSDEIVYAISLEFNKLLNINKGDIIEIALNMDLAPDLFIQK